MEHLTDEELVAEFRKEGDSLEGSRSLAINELFGRHYQRVCLWCYRFTGKREAAADLAQDVFLKAFCSMHTYRGEAKFSTWLYMIARNQSFTRFKAQLPAEGREDELTEVPDSALDPYQQLLKSSSRELVQKLLRESLTETEASVMTLHFANELPLETVSRLLRLENASGAKAYAVSAKRKLTRALDRLQARQKQLA